jgi:hypothetical protein
VPPNTVCSRRGPRSARGAGGGTRCLRAPPSAASRVNQPLGQGHDRRHSIPYRHVRYVCEPVGARYPGNVGLVFAQIAKPFSLLRTKLFMDWPSMYVATR